MKILIITLLSFSCFAQKVDSVKIKEEIAAKRYIADKIRSQHKIDSVKIAQKKLVKQPAKPKDNDK